MMVEKRQWWTIPFIAVRRTAAVDILVKAKADLNTQENVRLPYMYIHDIVVTYYCDSHSFITEYWVDSTNVCCR